jgi:hypothetical protein
MKLTDQKYVLETLRRAGKSAAEQIQTAAQDMTGTQLYAEDGYIPEFKAAAERKNMLERAVGFVCKSSVGRVVRLLQPYDSAVYPQEPEELPAQWGFVWSTDPEKALPFIALATSPYATGDCCTEGGHVWRSKMDNNTWNPNEYPSGWEDLGEVTR